MTPTVLQVLQARIEDARAFTSKFEALLHRAGPDGAVRDWAAYHAAHTGRWSSRGVQLHNMIRPPESVDIDAVLDAALAGDGERLRQLVPADLRFSDVLSVLLRPCFKARPGHVLLLADYNAIEPRCVGWMADEANLLDAYRADRDVYCEFASKYLFAPRIITKKEKPERQVSKSAVIGCGYQLGYERFGLYAAANGANLEVAGVTEMQVVEAYRDFVPNIAGTRKGSRDGIVFRKGGLWQAMKNAAVTCIERGRPQYAGKCEFVMRDGALVIILPSGRPLYYPGARIEPRLPKWAQSQPNAQPRPTIVYNKEDTTYGGKLVENCLTGDSKILSSRGWIALRELRLKDRVWDGVEWVEHDGVVCKGEQEVIDVDGVQMTPDHRVLTQEGWKHASSCEGHLRFEVDLPDGNPLCGVEREEITVGNSLRLRENTRDGGRRILQREAEIVRMQGPRVNWGRESNAWNEPASSVLGVAVDDQPLQSANPRRMEKLRRPGNSSLQALDDFQIILEGHGAVVPSGFDSGSNQQRRKLHEEKLSLGDVEGTGAEHAAANRRGSISGKFQVEQVDGGLSHRQRVAHFRVGSQTGRAESKAQVYDIVNCGPRHRFVVLGDSGPFIVHNCDQAMCRDLLATSMVTCEAEGLPVVLHAHDEIVCEVPEARAEEALHTLCDIMVERPDWAKGWPIKVEGYTSPRYTKNPLKGALKHEASVL